ncbi:uncharacterized protein LOC114195005 [Vigna unguiculata]|uniref:uncharacterized protein LOC114195005 n=1 Tax=Vigna unguiculata TaxID=3917 RepID=UPI001016D97F|nr:uncharacterized protein LOC114195005 [Vigna unguiculata]
MKHFDSIKFHHIPQEDNQLADALATLSSMFEISQDEEMSMIKMRSYEQPTYCYLVEEELDGKPWYFDIKRYLKTREYPETASENDKRTLRRLTSSFILNVDVLYKRNHDMTYADNINIAPTTLNVLSAPWPFAMWGINVIGAIEPKASNGHRSFWLQLTISPNG